MKAKEYTFESRYELGASLGHYSEDAIRQEPMFFSASPSFVLQHAGPVTTDFMLGILRDRPQLGGERLVIDTKVTMLMAGWYACIPGWHQDDVPRTSPDGQPNYDTPEYHAEHVMAIHDEGICQTEFAVGRTVLPGVPDGQVISAAWHEEIERRVLAERELALRQIPSRTLVYFDAHAIHRGTAAKRAGWRWFGRVSWKTDREVRNEVRTQVQVYLPSSVLNAGW